jgi:hypothetical protein
VVRNRHFPRLCVSCQAPMGGQEEACWRCGVTWAPEQPEQGPAGLRLITGGATPVVQPLEAPVVSTTERLARLIAEARA